MKSYFGTAFVFVFCCLLAPIEIPAFIQQLNLPKVLLLKSTHHLIAKPLWHLYLLLPAIPDVLLQYGEGRMSVQVLPQ